MAYTQTVIVLLIVACAAYCLVRRCYKSLKNKRNAPSCGCGCTACDISQSCEDIRSEL